MKRKTAEARDYRTDTDLRRAWAQLRRAGRAVSLDEARPLRLNAGPPADDGWHHRAYASQGLAARALQGLRRHGVRAAEPCAEHEACVRVYDAEEAGRRAAAPDRLPPPCGAGAAVRVTRGPLKGLRGTVEARLPGGTVRIDCGLLSKPLSAELPSSCVRALTDEELARERAWPPWRRRRPRRG